MSAPRVLVARLDSDGDVLLAGPAVRAVAAGSSHVTLLVSPSGEQAARLLPGVDDRLQVRRPLPATPVEGRYVVLHPSASVPARAPGAGHAAQLVRALAEAGHRVVVTGAPDDVVLAQQVAGDSATSLAGRTTFAELAGVLAGAAAVVCGNTGPAHLTAAVGTPVVSLFAPVVAAEAWAPWGVPHVLLGDQGAACAASRARSCPVAGHPCLSGIDPADVVRALEQVALVAA